MLSSLSHSCSWTPLLVLYVVLDGSVCPVFLDAKRTDYFPWKCSRLCWARCEAVALSNRPGKPFCETCRIGFGFVACLWSFSLARRCFEILFSLGNKWEFLFLWLGTNWILDGVCNAGFVFVCWNRSKGSVCILFLRRKIRFIYLFA